MAYLGSWKIDDLLVFVCNTHTASTGAATDADAVPAYRVYEDETTTPILTGTMALLDSANTAGLYSEQITLSAANGFEKGKSYNIYISAAVAAVTGTMSHSLQIEAEVDANRINWANVDGPTTTLNLSGTTIKTATDVETDTAVIGALGAGLTAIPWNPTWDAEVQSEVADALGVYDPPTEAEMNARTLSAASYLDAAGVRAAVGLATANLDTQLDALPTAVENATAVLTTAMTESYAADGSAFTLAQACYQIWGYLAERTIASVTGTVKKLDGSTTAYTLTYNDSAAPTSVTRAT